ncbi:polymer-forming cytoskeletal protein [Acetobacterium tundrae]|uniref:Polymer-forming cytoskeletal protein n=1 Tax=Acetobacterium tundrae TaxID=132932 RepID=A0ABR6WJF2_9FIRM|nr:polymer-forming cytoskeletal protein [Acetobacterium tundrae]MBC3796638.1 hypothetical protein [Acetobacterium tundrae]
MYKKISLSVLMMMMILLTTVSTAFGASEKYQGYYDNSGNISITDATVSDKDLFFAGSNIAVKSVFNATTFFVGNSVILDGEYNGDVFAAGNTVTINGKINGNLYTAGNQVTINGLVDGDVFSAGNNVTISNTATINRDLYIASSSAYMDGNVGRNLRFNAGNANINGTVNGYVESDVEQLIISNNAKVTGAIDNRSANEAIVSANALVPTINWEQVKEQKVEKDQGTSIGSIILSIITKLAFILVIWLLITFLTKDFRENTGIMAKKHILASLGIGAAMLFISPLLIGLSFIIYVPFGIAMTLLIIATCILSMPIAVVVFSKLLGRFFNDKMKPLLSSFVSVLIIAAAVIILEFIPFLGGFVGFFLMLFGLGFMGYNILFTNKKLKEERDLMTELVFTEKINNDVTEEVLAIEEKDENHSVEDSAENK